MNEEKIEAKAVQPFVETLGGTTNGKSQIFTSFFNESLGSPRYFAFLSSTHQSRLQPSQTHIQQEHIQQHLNKQEPCVHSFASQASVPPSLSDSSSAPPMSSKHSRSKRRQAIDSLFFCWVCTQHCSIPIVREIPQLTLSHLIRFE